MSLSRHKQACSSVLAECNNNINILQSVSTARGHMSMANVADDGVYNINDDYDYSLRNADNSSFEEDDANSAAPSHCDDKNSSFKDDDSDSAPLSNQDDDESLSDEDDLDSASLSNPDDDDSMDCGSADNYDDTLPIFSPPVFFKRLPTFTAAYRLQVELNTLFDQNKASLRMYDEIIRLFNDYVESPEFNRMTRLRPRQQFVAETERIFDIKGMNPIYTGVRLTDNNVATVPVFDATAMILSLIHDPTLMRPEHFAAGYDIFTGAELDGYECNNNYGEIHTGDAWSPALSLHCGRNGEYMPIALVIFGDKSHTDLHGALSIEPVSFTLSLFNRMARNVPRFWRLLGYIPNLSAGKGDANRMPAKDKVQNEHNCLSYVLKSLRDINRRGGLRTKVMGRRVHLKVWIHYFIGDTEGNNKWLGHYQSSNSAIARPYRDCKCSFEDLRKTNPECKYTTMQEMYDAKTLMDTNQQKGQVAFQKMSRHPIRNACFSVTYHYQTIFMDHFE